MRTEREVAQFLARWAETHTARDAEASSDLFLRDPSPVVTFSDGERAEDWLDVRIRLSRDLERAVIERVDLHGFTAREVTDEVVVVSFAYDLRVRDMWGTSLDAHRLATFTLVRTKDGLRIAAAQFAVPR